jgi:acyl carrier protein
MSDAEVEEAIRAFLTDQVLPAEESRALGVDTDLLEKGLMTSLTFVHMVAYIERRFDIEVTPAEFQPDNFRTIARCCAYVERKRRHGAIEAAGG